MYLHKEFKDEQKTVESLTKAAHHVSRVRALPLSVVTHEGDEYTVTETEDGGVLAVFRLRG
jgi:hypothetical protein